MQRPYLLVVTLLCLGGCGFYFYMSVSAEEPRQTPLAQNEQSQEYQTVGGSQPVVVTDPISSKAQATAELTLEHLLQLRGAPKSRITSNGMDILNYEDMSYRVKNGVIISKQTIERPRERQSHEESTRNLPASYAQQRQYRTPAYQPESYQPQQAAPIQDPERHRMTILSRAERWAQTMRTYNTYDWWHYSNISDLSQFSPVSGWPNRYSAQGVINMNTRHGNHAVNFEALLLLNDDGSFKDCEFTAK